MEKVKSFLTFGTNTKRWLNRIGSLLSIISLFFVVERLLVYRADISIDGWQWQQFTMLAALIVCYAVTNVPLAYGWHCLLTHLNAPQVWRWSIHTYAITLIAKYLPGNIFQFASRQIMGASVGVSQLKMAKSSMLEAALLALASICLTLILLPQFFRSLSERFAILCFFSSLIVTVTFFIYFYEKNIAKAAVAYATQVISSSVIFCCVFSISGAKFYEVYDIAIVLASFSLAWLIGLLTPGAPAGLGVREAILIFLLKDFAPTSVVLTSTLVGRVVTTLGDLLFYLFWKIR